MHLKLKIEISTRHQSNSDVKIIDGCGQLWSISCPTNGTLRDLANRMYKSVTYTLAKGVDVYLVFDRYYPYSIKGMTRVQRTANLSNTHVLSLDAPLQSREVIMISSINKGQ